MSTVCRHAGGRIPPWPGCRCGGPRAGRADAGGGSCRRPVNTDPCVACRQGVKIQPPLTVLPCFAATGRRHRELPSGRAMPGFFDDLAAERGLRPRPESIVGYRHHLACFEAYLDRIGVTRLQELSPAIRIA